MLYYLKQEVIGEHSDSVLKGANIRYLFYTTIHTISQIYTGSITEVHFNEPAMHLFFFSRDVDIWMPEMEQQEVPAGWWDTEADRSLLAGVFKHGGFSLQAQICIILIYKNREFAMA